MKDLSQNYIYSRNGNEVEKKHKIRLDLSNDDACRCFVPFVRFHHSDCPVVKKTCPLHGSLGSQKIEEKMERGSEQCMIISFHPTSKTDRLFQPIKTLLRRSPDTKVNIHYYSPNDSSTTQETLKHCQIQTSFEDLKKGFSNKFFVEKTKSFVSDKTNKIKKLRQCFYSPCNSTVQRTRSQMSVKEKKNEIFPEERTKIKNVSVSTNKTAEEKLITEGHYDINSESNLQWVCYNKLNLRDWENFSREKLDSDYVTVTEKDKSNVINHKIFEINYKKGVNDVPSDVKSPKNPAQLTHTVVGTEEGTKEKSEMPPQTQFGSAGPFSKRSSIQQKPSKNEDGKKNNGSLKEHGVSEKSHSSSSGSVYFTPFILMPGGLEDSDTDTRFTSLASVEKVDEGVQAEDPIETEQTCGRQTQTSGTSRLYRSLAPDEIVLLEDTLATAKNFQRKLSTEKKNERPTVVEQQTQTPSPYDTRRPDEIVLQECNLSRHRESQRQQNQTVDRKEAQTLTETDYNLRDEISLLEQNLSGFRESEHSQKKCERQCVNEKQTQTSTRHNPDEISLLERNLSRQCESRGSLRQNVAEQITQTQSFHRSTRVDEILLLEHTLRSTNESKSDLGKEGEPPPRLRLSYRNPVDNGKIDFKSVVLEIVRNARSSEVLARREQFTQTSKFSPSTSYESPTLRRAVDELAERKILSGYHKFSQEFPKSLETNRNKVANEGFDAQNKNSYVADKFSGSGPKLERKVCSAKTVEVFSRNEEVTMSKKMETRLESKKIVSEKKMENAASQTKQRILRDVYVEAIEVKRSKAQMAVPSHSNKGIQTSFKNIEQQELPTRSNPDELEEFLAVNNDDTYVVRPFQSAASEEALCLKSHSDSELYDSRKCDCGEIPLPERQVYRHTKFVDTTSSGGNMKTIVSIFDSREAVSGSTIPAAISESFEKAEEMSLKEGDDYSQVSNLSEVTRMIDSLFNKMGEEKLRFCDCPTPNYRGSKSGVDRGTMTEPLQHKGLEFVNVASQTPFHVIVDETAGGKSVVSQNLSRVRVRRSVLLDEKDQSKSVFVCTICAKEINTCTTDVGTSTEVPLVRKQGRNIADSGTYNKTAEIGTQRVVNCNTLKLVSDSPRRVGKLDIEMNNKGGKQSPSPGPADKRRSSLAKTRVPTPSPRKGVAFKCETRTFVEAKKSTASSSRSPNKTNPKFPNVESIQKARDNFLKNHDQKVIFQPVECVCNQKKVPSTSRPRRSDVHPLHPPPPTTPTKGLGLPQAGRNNMMYPAFISTGEFFKNIQLIKKLQKEVNFLRVCKKPSHLQKRNRDGPEVFNRDKKIKCDEFDEISIFDLCRESYEEGLCEGLIFEDGSVGDHKTGRNSGVRRIDRKDKNAGCHNPEKSREFATSQIPVLRKYFSPHLKVVTSEEKIKQTNSRHSTSYRRTPFTTPHRNAENISGDAKADEKPFRKLSKCRVCKSLTFLKRGLISQQREGKFSGCDPRSAVLDENSFASTQDLSKIFIPAKKSHSPEELWDPEECFQSSDKVAFESSGSSLEDRYRQHEVEEDECNARETALKTKETFESDELYSPKSRGGYTALECDALSDSSVPRAAPISKSRATFWFGAERERKKIKRGNNFHSRLFQVLKNKSFDDANLRQMPDQSDED